MPFNQIYGPGLPQGHVLPALLSREAVLSTLSDAKENNMRALIALLLLSLSTFGFAAPSDDASSDQLAKLLFNDPNSPRTGAASPKLTIVSFTDYNCPYCKQFDPMLEKIVQENPDVQLIVKLLPFKGQSSVNAAKAALDVAAGAG